MNVCIVLSVVLVAMILACEVLPDPANGLFVDPSAAAAGDGSECSPFQSLTDGLSAAARLPIAAVHIGSGEVEVSMRTAIANQLTITGAPSTLVVAAPLIVENSGKLQLRLLYIKESSGNQGTVLECMGGFLSLESVEEVGGTTPAVQIAGGKIEIRDSTFSGMSAPVLKVLNSHTSVTVQDVIVLSCDYLLYIDEDYEGTIEVTMNNISVTQSGRLVYCREFAGERFAFNLESGVIDKSSKELLANSVRNAVVEVRNTTVSNSLQVMTGIVINSTIAFTNCTFRQGKSSLIDLSSFLGDITFHNSTITELQGPLILIPANQYHYSLARISISSCRISKFTNLNGRVTGGIANIASTSLAIRDSEIWGGNVSFDGLFTLTSGFASIDNLYFHDSSAVTYSLFEAKLSVVAFTNIVVTRLTHTTNRYTGCTLSAQCLWSNVSITDSINPNPLVAASYTLLWSAFGGNTTVRNSYFRNPGRSNPCMGPSDSGRLYIFNSTFSDLTNNGVFVVLSDGQLLVSNITLVRPNVVILFTCYWAAKCVDARYVKVEGKSSISAVIGGNGDYSISDSVFSGVYYSYFVARGGTLTVNNVTAIASTGYLCRACEKTNITISSLSVVDLASPYVFEAFDCNISLSHSTVSGITTTQFFSLEASTLVMEQTTFSSIKVDSFGGLLIASNAAVFMHSVWFSDIVSTLSIQIGLLYLDNSHLDIAESTFVRFNSTLIYAFESRVNIANSKFTEGGMYYSTKPKTVLSYGGVLWSESSPSIAINNCTFQKLSSDFGGALYLSGSGTETCGVSNSSASLSSAKQKGGFAYISKVKTSITNSAIFNNSANYGGAIWAGGDRGELLLTIDNSQFTNNTATFEGGAVQTIKSTVYYRNITLGSNTATYGQNFASTISRLSVIDSLMKTPFHNFTINVASGQVHKEEIVIACLDELDQVVTTEQFTKLTLSAENSTITLPILLEAKNGLFTIPSVTVIGKPTSYVKVSAELGSAEKQEVFAVRIRQCEDGEYFVDSRCDLCTHSTYSFTPSQPCTLCPVHADCPLGFRLDLHPGHWRANNMTDVIYDCIVPELCLGGFDSECEEGHSRVMCAHCGDHLFKVNQLQCIECSHKAVSALKAILTFVVSTASIVYSQFLDEQTQMIHIVIFDYLQSVRILENFNIYWPKSLAYLHSVMGDIGSVGLTAFTDSCFGAITGIHQIYSQLIVAALYSTLLLFVIGWICLGIKKRYKKFEVGRMVSVIFYFGYLLLPLLFMRMLQMFACFHVGEKYYLIYDSSEECWTHQHLSYSLAVALPVLLLSVTIALLLLAVSLLPSELFQQPYISTLSIMLIRKFSMATLLIFSNAWALCTQVSVVLAINITTEILLLKFTKNKDLFYFSLYQSTLNASILYSFACVIYNSVVSSLKDKQGPFIAVNYLCIFLPLVYGLFLVLSRLRRGPQVQVVPMSEGPLKLTENALKTSSHAGFEVSEIPLQAPNSSFASIHSPSSENLRKD